MVYHGRIENGAVVIDGSPALPDGAEVRVEVMGAKANKSQDYGQTLSEALLSLAGIVDDLPADFAHNHHHYIHGTPKK